MKKKLSLAVILFQFVLAGCDNGVSGGNSTMDYQQNKMSLEDQEKSDPLRFLTTDGTYRSTLFGSKRVINGSITNSASIATFKDVNINVHFYAKTGTEIKSAVYVVYDFFPPGQTKTFEMKIEAPVETSTLGWDVLSATAK